MSPSAKAQSNIRIDEDLRVAMAAVKERDGIPISEQIRRALRAWLEAKGALTPTKQAAPRRAGTRRKA